MKGAEKMSDQREIMIDPKEICCGVGVKPFPCEHSPTGLLKDRRDRRGRLDGGGYGLAFRDEAGQEIRLDSESGSHERMDALEEAARNASSRIQNQWRPGYVAGAPSPHADSLDETRRRAEYRINNAARSPGAPARVNLCRQPNEDAISFAVREYVAGENRLAAVNRRINSQWKGEQR
jgi:hypothetical protein